MTRPAVARRRLRSPARPDRHRSAAHAATAPRAAYFDDPRLVQWAGRYATYSGSSPYRGAGHAGLHRPRRGALRLLVPDGRAGRAARRARARGRRGRASSCAAAPRSTSISVDGVAACDRRRRLRRRRRRAAGGRRRGRQHRRRAPVPDLLPDDAEPLRRVRRAEPLDQRVRGAGRRARPHAGHRPPQRLVRGDYAAPSSPQLDARASWPTTPRSTPASSSVTDPTQAPAGRRELVPAGERAAPASTVDRRRVRDARCSTGSPSRASTCAPRLAFTEHDHAGRPRAALPVAGRRRSTARRRTVGGPRSSARPTVAPVRGLYLVGGTSHPGGGLPLVAIERPHRGRHDRRTTLVRAER